MTILKNQFIYIDNEFHLTTVNKQNSFYYRVTKPREVWGNYYTQIAFFDRKNEIVYHRQTCFAHVLHVDISLEFVKWSANGDAALFYEYRRGNIEGEGIYHYLLLDLTEKIVYRIDLYKYDYSFLENLKTYHFDKTDIINQLSKIGVGKEQCFTDKIIISPLKWLIGIAKWKPTGRF